MANRIWIELPRDRYFTGEVVAGAVALETTGPAEARSLSLDVLGREATEITRSSGEHSYTYRSQADRVAWRVPLMPPAALSPGVRRFPFRFQVPEDALPSYEGTCAKIRYTLTARLDVPWWPDAVCTAPVYVYYARQSVRTFANPFGFRSGGVGPLIYVELDGDRFFARELIGCRITLLQLGEHRVRRVYVQLLGGEWARAQNQEQTTRRTIVSYDIPMGTIQVGVPFTFEIAIPADLPSSYRGTYSYYTYYLRFGLDIAWAADLVAETPIVIVQ